MAVVPYSEDVERTMRSFYDSLRERDRRCYAAVEASKLGHGGIGYIATVLGCSERTIRRGLGELKEPVSLPPQRSREKGGGDANEL